MPMGDVVFLSFVVIVFAAFMAALAWGAYQTREMPKD